MILTSKLASVFLPSPPLCTLGSLVGRTSLLPLPIIPTGHLLVPGGSPHCPTRDLLPGLHLDIGIRGVGDACQTPGAGLDLGAGLLTPDAGRNSSDTAEGLLVDRRVPWTQAGSFFLVTSHELPGWGNTLDTKKLWASPASTSTALCPPKRHPLQQMPLLQITKLQGPNTGRVGGDWTLKACPV